MSILKLANDAGNCSDTLYKKMQYITRSDACRQEYIYGYETSSLHAYEAFMLTRKVYCQEHGKAYYHFIIRPENTDLVLEPDDFFGMLTQITVFLANYDGHRQAVSAIHFDDGERLHGHCILNNIDMHTGKRWNIDRATLRDIKENISHILKNYGLSEIR